MKCILAIALVAISTNIANATGFYVQAGTAELQQYSRRDNCLQITEINISPKGGYSVLVPVDPQCSNFSQHDINDVRNPYGAFGFGYDWQWRAIVVDFQFQRQMSVSVSDRGQNSLRLNLRWYPFQ